MKNLFAVKPVDRKCYRERIRDLLPENIIDIHTHIWQGVKPGAEQVKRVVTWPSRVATEHPVEDLVQTYRLLFPGKTVTPLLFNTPSRGKDMESRNDYVRESAQKHRFPALMLSRPDWTAREFAQKMDTGQFLGAKPYLTFAPPHLPADEIRILDFMPPHQLAMLNERKKILMLHIPRSGRLKDPVNLAQLLAIEERYPEIRLIVAHVGRAYCPEDVGDAFRVLAGTKRMLFDISANTNETVFYRLLTAVAPERVLFGSDLPITRMRMRRICEGGIYVNLVPKGLYGDLSGDRNMREVGDQAATKLTFFLYEEILALLKAAERAGLENADLKKVFHDNAAAILKDATGIAPASDRQLQMILPERARKRTSAGTRPRGYTLRTWRPGDEAPYAQLMRKAGFEGWDKADEVLQSALPGGLFFFVHNASRRIVATACAHHRPTARHPGGGELGWVAVDPAHRGKGLGHAVCAAVINRFIAAGYQSIYLSTDDHRRAAIKIYFKLGFVPFPDPDNTRQRWRKVKKELGSLKIEKGAEKR